MNPLKEFLKRKFSVNFEALSPVKQHAFKAFETFNSIAQSEIQNKLIQTTFDMVKEWVASKMLKKPDNELKNMMLKVYQDMSPLFVDVSIAIEAQASEALGSVKIPRVGELARKMQIVEPKFNEVEAMKIMKELFK